jgi:hypothetical protein
MIASNAMSNHVSAADLLRCLYRLIHDESPPIEETLLLLFKMFIELLHYYVMAQSQWAHYNTV